MKKIGFIVQFLCLTLFSFGQSAGEGIRFIEGEKWENILKMAQEQNKIYLYGLLYLLVWLLCKALAKSILHVRMWGIFLMLISST